jgi:hypothetical protein
MLEDFAFALLIGHVLKLRPKIAKIGGKLVARSSIGAQFLTLFAACRRVTVDPLQRVIRVQRRVFWFFTTTRRIEFDWVLNVTHDYREIAPTSSFSWAYYSSDLFTVGLLMKNGEEVLLFRFFGGGQFTNDSLLADWMYWREELTGKIMHGNQEREAKIFADTVGGIVGVPVRQPMSYG